MSSKTLSSRHSIDSCALQFHSWKPFSNSKTLESDSYNSNPKSTTSTTFQYPKRPCLSDRATSAFSVSIDSIDMSKLSLFDDPYASQHPSSGPHKREKFRWIDRRKRRRRGSRSLSGKSSDRSHGTRNGRCCSVGATATATATCSDFMVAATDSSGELFGHGNANGAVDLNYWSSDMSEAKNSRREKVGDGNGSGNGTGDRENLGCGFGFDSAQWSESGYGSEPGYRGDAEFGYGDEFDEEEEDARFFFWVRRDTDVEMIRENGFLEQKTTHHRGRRKKHDWKMDGSGIQDWGWFEALLPKISLFCDTLYFMV